MLRGGTKARTIKVRDGAQNTNADMFLQVEGDCSPCPPCCSDVRFRVSVALAGVGFAVADRAASGARLGVIGGGGMHGDEREVEEGGGGPCCIRGGRRRGRITSTTVSRSRGSDSKHPRRPQHVGILRLGPPILTHPAHPSLNLKPRPPPSSANFLLQPSRWTLTTSIPQTTTATAFSYGTNGSRLDAVAMRSARTLPNFQSQGKRSAHDRKRFRLLHHLHVL